VYEGSITIICKNEVPETERVLRAVTQFCDLHQAPPRALHAITLALDEILTNVIRYAHNDGAAHEITVRVEHTTKGLTAEIEDDGKAFNPLAAPPVDVTKPLSEREVGGLGIHLVRSLMNDVAYERRDGKNVLTITRTIPSPK